MRRSLAISVCVLVTAGAVRAELVYFERGGQAQLPAIVKGDAVTLSTPSGPMEFRRADFRKIVTGYDPDAEWVQRQADALRGAVRERYAAAWWALENGLTPQAEQMLRSAASADPTFEPVKRLVPLLDRFNQPLAEPDISASGTLAPGRSSVAQSAHIILVHQHSEVEAQSRLAVLERVFRSFYITFAAQGIELQLPARKLVSVWFADKGDYLAFLKREGAGNFLTTRGYYHPTKGFVLAFDARSDASKRRAAANLQSRRREWDGFERALTALSSGEQLELSPRFEAAQRVNRDRGLEIVAEHRRDVARQALLLDLECRSLDLGTAAHELIHQLVAESGLAARHADFPFWLHEGLAMQFEVIRGGRWAGISRVNDQRLSDFRKMDPAPRLAPLIRDRGFGQGYRADLYGEAWSLVFFLRKEHPEAFISWLNRLRQSPRDKTSPSQRSAMLFDDSFSQAIPTMEESWRAYSGRLKTVFEEGETSVTAPDTVHSD
jgi:hypothetical protein